MRLSLSELSSAVRELVEPSSTDVVLFHTEIIRMGIPAGVSPRDALHTYSEMLESACGSRVLVFPTFNYDFCRTGIYDVSADPCQVGALNDHYRMHRARARTLTPVFNFCSSSDSIPISIPSDNPFDESSTFAELRRRGAQIVFFGAPFSSNTFLHHVEEDANVGYRYIKPFPGVIRSANESRAITLRYRVRPLDDSVVYDWKRLEEDLRSRGILRSRAVGNATLLACGAEDLFRYWRERLGEDELWLLTAESRRAVQRLAASVGYPFRYEKLEPADIL